MPVFTIKVKPQRGSKKEKEILKQIAQLEEARVKVQILLATCETECSIVKSQIQEAQIKGDQDLIGMNLYELQCLETQCESYKKTLILLNKKLVDKQNELSMMRVEMVLRGIFNDDTHVKTSPQDVDESPN